MQLTNRAAGGGNAPSADQ